MSGSGLESGDVVEFILAANFSANTTGDILAGLARKKQGNARSPNSSDGISEGGN